jgi:hypothetical protein
MFTVPDLDQEYFQLGLEFLYAVLVAARSPQTNLRSRPANPTGLCWDATREVN